MVGLRSRKQVGNQGGTDSKEAPEAVLCAGVEPVHRHAGTPGTSVLDLLWTLYPDPMIPLFQRQK